MQRASILTEMLLPEGPESVRRIASHTLLGSAPEPDMDRARICHIPRACRFNGNEPASLGACNSKGGDHRLLAARGQNAQAAAAPPSAAIWQSINFHGSRLPPKGDFRSETRCRQPQLCEAPSSDGWKVPFFQKLGTNGDANALRNTVQHLDCI